jgi:hypothetical protein
VSSGESRAVDSGQPILLWEPDPTCDHTQNDDCEHFAIWVATRLASDTLERGTMVLELRELSDDDDDFGYVAVANDIVLTCALDSGAVEPRGREGEIFLRHHPWLVDSLRAELDFLRGRAARAAAQLDRESAPKKALAVPASTMIAYHRLFPADWDLIPIRDGERYWAVDLYCRNPDCSCSSSAIQFYQLDHGDPQRVGEVVVDYAERDIEYESSNDAVEAIFDQLWGAREYSLRARHAQARDAVRRFVTRPLLSVTPQASLDRVPRNAVCPCGSGKKFKRCCLDASRSVRP